MRVLRATALITALVGSLVIAGAAPVGRAAGSEICRHQNPLIRVCVMSGRSATYPMLQVALSWTIEVFGDPGTCVPVETTTSERDPAGHHGSVGTGQITACVGDPPTELPSGWQNGARFSPLGTWTLTYAARGAPTAPIAYQEPSGARVPINLQAAPPIPLTCAAPSTITYCTGLFRSFPDGSYATGKAHLGELLAGELHVTDGGCGCTGVDGFMVMTRPDGAQVHRDAGLVYWPTGAIDAVPFWYQTTPDDPPGTYRFTFKARPPGVGAHFAPIRLRIRVSA